MAFDPKKDYWWMSISEDFFESEELSYLEDEISNGSLYALLFVKLCLMSLKNKGFVGRVVADAFLPFSEAKLATVNKMDSKDVKMALPILERLNLIQLCEGIIYIPLVDSMVGEKKAGLRKIESEKRQIRRMNAIKKQFKKLSGQLSDTTKKLKPKTDSLQPLKVTTTEEVVIHKDPVDNPDLAIKIRKLEANGIRTSVELFASQYTECELDAYIHYAQDKSKKENHADLLFYALKNHIDIDPKYLDRKVCPQCQGEKYEYFNIEGIEELIKGACSICKGKGYIRHKEEVK